MAEFKYFKRNRGIEEYPMSSHVLQIKVDDIRPNRSQPRADFDNNSIIRLADSIRRYGIIQPLTVRRSDIDDIYAYELVAGERRLRAARILGYFTVPCIIIEVDERMSAEMAIIENLLRKDLNMFEQAYGFKKLIENYGLTQDEVARRMSLSQSAVANKIRLLKLTDLEQEMILENELSERHARSLLKIDSIETRIEVIRYISSMSMNVINSEKYIETVLKRAESRQKDAKTMQVGAKERSVRLFVDGVKRRVGNLNKQGENATVDVLDLSDVVEVRIKIAK